MEVKKVGPFEAALHGYMNSAKADLMKRINDTGDFGADVDKSLNEAISQFKQTQTW